MTDAPIRTYTSKTSEMTYKIPSAKKLTIAIIPTGEYYRGCETMEDLKKRSKNGITFYLPNKDGHLINTDEETTEITSHKEINWGYASAYSPETRAEMLYDAIFNKKLDYIFITGGRGNEYTILELEKLINTRKPELSRMPIVYGMSDATNLLNYLGQKGIAKPYIATNIFEPFSFKNPEGKPEPIIEENLRQEITRFDGQDDELEGILIPEYSLRSYGTIQEMRFFKDKVNFLATEIDFPRDSELMIEIYNSIKPEDRKNIVFCLSAVGRTNMTEEEKERYKKEYSDNYKKRNSRDIEERELYSEMRYLETMLRHNRIKQEEQNKFKEWCIENGFRVIYGIKFGHQNDRNQYLPIPSYCKCKLNGNTLEYTTVTVPLPTDPIKIEISQQDGQKCNTLEFYQNYIPGGGSEVSRWIDVETKKSASIFSQARKLQPNARGEFNVLFDSFKNRKGCPPFVYIQDLERVLKDIDKLKIQDLKTIKISNFDLPLEDLANPPSKKTNKEAIIETISYISKSYKNLQNVKINLGNGLEFKNGILNQFSEKSSSNFMTM